MGHHAEYQAAHIPSSDKHYFSNDDVEFNRELYKEKAMPHLRLDTRTPSETEQTIQQLQQEVTELREKVQVFGNPLFQRLIQDAIDRERGTR